jgi:DNA-binding transcriptional regulator YdaS (Cro superfamily)
MTTDEFNLRASACLGGRGWMTRLAAITGVHYATVKRWASGELVVPAYACALIELLEVVPEAMRPERFHRQARRAA